MVQLYPALSGLETLRYFADLSGRARSADGDLRRLLDRVGLQRDDADQILVNLRWRL